MFFSMLSWLIPRCENAYLSTEIQWFLPLLHRDGSPVPTFCCFVSSWLCLVCIDFFWLTSRSVAWAFALKILTYFLYSLTIYILQTSGVCICKKITRIAYNLYLKPCALSPNRTYFNFQTHEQWACLPNFSTLHVRMWWFFPFSQGRVELFDLLAAFFLLLPPYALINNYYSKYTSRLCCTAVCVYFWPSPHHTSHPPVLCLVLALGWETRCGRSASGEEKGGEKHNTNND